MRFWYWLKTFFLQPRINMNIYTELVKIFKTLTGLESTLAGMGARFNSLEYGNAGIMDGLLAQDGLTKYVIATQASQLALLQEILEAVTPPPAVKVIFTIKVGNTITEGATKVKIKDNQEFDVAVSFTDAAGNAASVQGAPAWTVDNTAALTVTPSADGLSAVVSAVGPTGTGQVSVSADADLGDGTTTITGVLAVEVIAGDATMIVLNPGPARDKAAPAPPAPPAP